MSKSGNTVKSFNLAISGSGQNLGILAIFGELAYAFRRSVAR